MNYSISEAAKITKLTPYTLRYYEKEGLLPFVRKTQSGLRIYTDNDIAWIGLIECLKSTGMPLKGIKQYIDWFIAGDSTLSQRLNMFKEHRINVKNRLTQMRKNLERINHKIELYEEAVRLGSLEKAKSCPQFLTRPK